MSSSSSRSDSPRSFLTWVKTSTAGSLLVLGVVALVVLAAVWGVAAIRSKESGASAGAGGELEGATAVETPDTGAPAPKIGEPAPLFTATDTAGDKVDLESLRGGPVWLVFNATWCADCRAELPDIQEAHQEFGDQVQIVGIYLSDSEAQVVDYAERLGLTFEQVADPSSELGALYRVMAVPTHYFLDAEGTAAAIDIGTLSPKAIQENLESLLSDS